VDIKLVMFRSDGKRKDFPIVNETVTIGRGENCELRVPLSSVSRKHCELIVLGGKLKVRDLSSSNGTYVNNKRIAEQDLNAGDRLVVGPVVFTVQIDGVPEQIQPVKTKGQKLAESSLMGQAAAKAAEAEAKEETGVPITAPGGEEDADTMAALEELVAEALQEDEEDQKEGTAA